MLMPCAFCVKGLHQRSPEHVQGPCGCRTAGMLDVMCHGESTGGLQRWQMEEEEETSIFLPRLPPPRSVGEVLCGSQRPLPTLWVTRGTLPGCGLMSESGFLHPARPRQPGARLCLLARAFRNVPLLFWPQEQGCACLVPSKSMGGITRWSSGTLCPISFSLSPVWSFVNCL